MRRPLRTSRVKKDVELARKRGKNLAKLRMVMQQLIDEVPLQPRHRDHALVGKYRNRRECHLEPDWLLIYKLEGNNIIFERSGTHADLFR
ncbi:type II toxin-antitoxin system YafQ family toxin [soil metagenome]